MVELASLAYFSCGTGFISSPLFTYIIEDVFIISAISGFCGCCSWYSAVFSVSIYFESLRRKLSKIKLFIVIRICCISISISHCSLKFIFILKLDITHAIREYVSYINGNLPNKIITRKSRLLEVVTISVNLSRCCSKVFHR